MAAIEAARVEFLALIWFEATRGNSQMCVTSMYIPKRLCLMTNCFWHINFCGGLEMDMSCPLFFIRRGSLVFRSNGPQISEQECRRGFFSRRFCSHLTEVVTTHKRKRVEFREDHQSTQGWQLFAASRKTTSLLCCLDDERLLYRLRCVRRVVLATNWIDIQSVQSVYSKGREEKKEEQTVRCFFYIP